MEGVVILIVDDDPDSREMLQLWLCSEGYEVLTAEDGAAALALLQQAQPALILTDLRMPGIDGFELIRRVRALPSLKCMPIIAMSADHIESHKMEELKTTIVLCKPLNLECLAEEIKKILLAAPPKRRTKRARPGTP